MNTGTAALARLRVFSTLDKQELTLLEPMLRTRWLEPGGVLFSEGDRAAACFVLLSGQIGVYKQMNGGRQERLAVVGPGSLIGELALIDGRPRSATAKAEGGPAVLLGLDREAFDGLFQADRPFAFKILDHIVTELASRLRQATARLVQAAGGEPAGRAAAPAPILSEAERARDAAAALLGVDADALDLDDIDLDAITFDIPEGTPPPANRQRR